MHLTISGFVVLLVVMIPGCGKQSASQNDQRESADSIDASTAAVESKLTEPVTVASAWSEPVNGLKARWLVRWSEFTYPNYPTRANYQDFTLEVRNVGSDLLAFPSAPTFKDLRIKNAKGEAVEPPGHVAGNHLSGILQWAIVPNSANAYLGLRIDTAIPVHHGVHFESFMTENHSLHARLYAEKQKGPENQWIGEIELPALVLDFIDTPP